MSFHFNLKKLLRNSCKAAQDQKNLIKNVSILNIVKLTTLPQLCERISQETYPDGFKAKGSKGHSLPSKGPGGKCAYINTDIKRAHTNDKANRVKH